MTLATNLSRFAKNAPGQNTVIRHVVGGAGLRNYGRSALNIPDRELSHPTATSHNSFALGAMITPDTAHTRDHPHRIVNRP